MNERERRRIRRLVASYNLEGYFAGEVKYPNRELRHKTRKMPLRPVTWTERPTGVSPFVAKSNSGFDLEDLFSVSNAWFWNRVRRDRRGNLANKPKEEGGFEYPQLFKGFADYGNAGSGFLVLREGFIPVQCVGVNTNLYKGLLSAKTANTADVPNIVQFAPTPIAVLNAFGTACISKVAPTKPHANLAAFLGELREGLPALPGSSLKDDGIRNLGPNLGGEYLNYQFGIKPTVEDLKEICGAISKSRSAYEQFLRDADRRVRRQYYTPSERSTQLYSNVRINTGSAITGYSTFRGDVSDEITIDRWFSGAFRYTVPNGNSALDRLKLLEARANNLLGTRLTPEVIWQLSPWSWMADWFGNVGDIITNVTLLNSDGLEMQYGYVMEEKTVKRTLSCNTPYGTVTSVHEFHVKRRVPATPFGFDVAFDGLSNYQKSIVAALAISRGRKSG